MPSRREILRSASLLGGISLLGLTASNVAPDEAEDTDTTGVRQSVDSHPVQNLSPSSNRFQEENEPDDEPVWHNVRDYGARGNGLSDDTFPIQLALENAEHGDTVYIPPGDYLVGSHDSAGIVEIPTHVTNLEIRGEPGYNTTRLIVAQNRYDVNKNFGIFRIPLDRKPVKGLSIRNLTFDGDRPPGRGEPSSRAIHCYPSGAGGGHDVLIEDCWAENFSGAAMVAREGGVRFNRITAVDNKQNFGVSEEDDSTRRAGEYGVEITNSLSMNADWVGIDHNRGGTVRIDGLYSANNGRSGLKTTKDNRRTRVENATFQSEEYFAAVRTNIGTTADLPDPPLEISLDTVAIQNAGGGGIYLSGDDSSVYNSTLIDGPIEIRNCGGARKGSEGGLTFHSAGGGQIDELRVIGTEDGPGVWFSGRYALHIETLYHANNEGGAVKIDDAKGELTVNTQINDDPGSLETPGENDVGAWSREEDVDA